MPELPAEWGALCAMVFLLGLRHGMDADHLSAIDGLTRLRARRQHARAGLCGLLFALGHGAVVLAIVLLAGTLGARWAAPRWFETAGAVVSIGFLALIGVANLRVVRRTAIEAPVTPVGVRSRVLGRLFGRDRHAAGPLAVLATGSLFALSFDTLGQSTLFAVLGLRFGGLAHALALGLLFVAGMLVSDGVNGWWIRRLIGRTDRLALVASRTMTTAVALTSLLVAAVGAARLASGPIDGWFEGKGLGLGLAVILLVVFAYLLACRSARQAPPGAARA